MDASNAAIAVFVLERQRDVVEALEQAPALEVVDLEREPPAVRSSRSTVSSLRRERASISSFTWSTGSSTVSRPIL